MITLIAVPLGTFLVDRRRSSIVLDVHTSAPTDIRSAFTRYDARVVDGVLDVSVDVTSTLPDFGNATSRPLSPSFFGAEAEPSLGFRSVDTRVEADGTAFVDGDLTIQGVAKPVFAKGRMLTRTRSSGNTHLAFSLVAVVDRRDFGIRWQDPLSPADDRAAWNVAIALRLELAQQEPPVSFSAVPARGRAAP